MSPARSPRSAGFLALAALVLVPLASACGDDVEGAAADSDELEIAMADFTYGAALPATVPAGTRIVATNESPTELHEFVAVRLADDDERPVEEIVAGGLEAVLASPPTAVVLAPPGEEEPIVAVGDGTLQDPGRYLVVCMIPTGVDPAVYLEAASASDGPPQVDGGPPHVAHGMFAELTVVP